MTFQVFGSKTKNTKYIIDISSIWLDKLKILIHILKDMEIQAAMQVVYTFKLGQTSSHMFKALDFFWTAKSLFLSWVLKVIIG